MTPFNFLLEFLDAKRPVVVRVALAIIPIRLINNESNQFPCPSLVTPVSNSNLEIPSILDYTRIGAALNQTERRICISLLSGLSTTLVLTFLPTLVIRVFPYRDLPMMPKPFFLYALPPGIIAGEWFAHGWIQESVFLLTNSVVYAVAAFGVIAVNHACSRRA